jgi:hypothetical protein
MVLELFRLLLSKTICFILSSLKGLMVGLASGEFPAVMMAISFLLK